MWGWGWRREEIMWAARSTTSASLVLGAVVLAAACGNGGADAAPETTTSTAPDVTETTGDEEEAKLDEVIDAHVAARAATCEALGPPTPDGDDPDLLATHMGPVLEVTQEVAEEFAEEGIAFHCPEDSSFDIEVLSFEFGEFEGDETVWLELCVIDDSERVVVETGEVVGGGLTAVHSSDVMRRVDGKWRLAELRVNEQWEGEGECEID